MVEVDKKLIMANSLLSNYTLDANWHGSQSRPAQTHAARSECHCRKTSRNPSLCAWVASWACSSSWATETRTILWRFIPFLASCQFSSSVPSSVSLARRRHTFYLLNFRKSRAERRFRVVKVGVSLCSLVHALLLLTDTKTSNIRSVTPSNTIPQFWWHWWRGGQVHTSSRWRGCSRSDPCTNWWIPRTVPTMTLWARSVCLRWSWLWSMSLCIESIVRQQRVCHDQHFVNFNY